MNKIASFEDFKNLGKKKVQVGESKKLQEKRVTQKERKASKKKASKKEDENIKEEVVKESATFKVGGIYKVKTTYDVPVRLISNYIEKVKKETSKDPLDNFNEKEIAEEIIKHILKTNMEITEIPSSLTVGDSALEKDVESEESISDDFEGEDIEIEDETPEDNSQESEDDGVDFEYEEEDESDNKEEDDSKIDFEGEEVDLGEEIEIEEEK